MREGLAKVKVRAATGRERPGEATRPRAISAVPSFGPWLCYTMPDAPPHPGATPRENIACVHCRYNLRGLSGNPLRCPECGQLTHLPYPPELVDAALSEFVGDFEVACGNLVMALFWAIVPLAIFLGPDLSAESILAVALTCAIPVGFHIFFCVRRARRLAGRLGGCRWRRAFTFAGATLLVDLVCSLGIGVTAIAAGRLWYDQPPLRLGVLLQVCFAAVAVGWLVFTICVIVRMHRYRVRLFKPSLLEAAQLRAAELHAERSEKARP
jgi:hypothetical protein